MNFKRIYESANISDAAVEIDKRWWLWNLDDDYFKPFDYFDEFVETLIDEIPGYRDEDYVQAAKLIIAEDGAHIRY